MIPLLPCLTSLTDPSPPFHPINPPPPSTNHFSFNSLGLPLVRSLQQWKWVCAWWWGQLVKTIIIKIYISSFYITWPLISLQIQTYTYTQTHEDKNMHTYIANTYTHTHSLSHTTIIIKIHVPSFYITWPLISLHIQTYTQTDIKTETYIRIHSSLSLSLANNSLSHSRP